MDVAALQKTLDEIAAEYVRRLNLRIESIDEEAVTLRLPVAPGLVHGGGVLCGQAIMSAADTAMLVAMIVRVGSFKPMTTVQLQTSFLRPVPKETADLAMDAAACIGCGACVAACKNAAAHLFTSAKVTHLAHYNIDVIEGHEVHTINPDESRTYAAIHMYENRLYIAEATVPKGAPASNWFQISLRFLDEQYRPVRYQYSGLMTYSNGYPKPPLANQNQGAQGQAAQGQGR